MNEQDIYHSYKSSKNYQGGYCYGYLIGRLISIMESIDICIKLFPEKILDILSIPIEYYEEIITIRNKYPNYSLEHQAKKVFFESSYMPYYSDTSK